MPIGRPPEPVPEAMAAEVCAWLAAGKSLTSFCKQEGKVHRSTVHDWRDKDDDFRRRFARAKQEGNEVIEEECFDIADDGSNDWMEIQDKEGNCVGWRVNGEAVQRSKLRVETRLKILANRDPERYGSKAKEANNLTPEVLAQAFFALAERARETTAPRVTVETNGNGHTNGNGNGHG